MPPNQAEKLLKSLSFDERKGSKSYHRMNDEILEFDPDSDDEDTFSSTPSVTPALKGNKMTLDGPLSKDNTLLFKRCTTNNNGIYHSNSNQLQQIRLKPDEVTVSKLEEVFRLV